MGAEATCGVTFGRKKDAGKALLETDALITEMEVMKAGKAAGLVDVKVVRYSDTHTAEKYVIPLRLR